MATTFRLKRRLYAEPDTVENSSGLKGLGKSLLNKTPIGMAIKVNDAKNKIFKPFDTD